MSDNHPVGRPHASEDYPRYILRLVPALNVAALRATPRHDKQIMMWYCLRAIDSTGRGVLDQRQVIKTLCVSFGYRRQTVYKHLKTGDAAYWRLHRTRRGRAIIILRGLLHVARYVGADIGKRDHFVQIPASDLPKSSQGQARRALLYNAGAYQPESAALNYPISRRSLQDKTGFAPRQQRRYDHVSESHGAVRQVTFGSYRDPKTMRLKNLVRVVQTDSGSFRTNQLPNRYRTWCLRGRRGMLPRVARSLNPSNKSSSRGEATFDTSQRRYYRDFQCFLRAASGGEVTVGYYPSRCDDHTYICATIF